MRAEELVWRFRELSDWHAGWTVFYQVSAERLPLYVDLGLAVMKLGEEARVALPDFSLEGSARAELRTQRRRAERDGAVFEVLQPQQLAPLMPQLQAISDAWLEDKAVAEKSYSVGAFSRAYISNFPVAVVRIGQDPVAFASLWIAGTGDEIAVDLMRFGPDAPRGAMDFLFVELMLWGRAQGYRWLNLGMAPLTGWAVSYSAMASTSTTSMGCAATRPNSIRCGNPSTWPHPGDWRCRAYCSISRCSSPAASRSCSQNELAGAAAGR